MKKGKDRDREKKDRKSKRRRESGREREREREGKKVKRVKGGKKGTKKMDRDSEKGQRGTERNR